MINWTSQEYEKFKEKKAIERSKKLNEILQIGVPALQGKYRKPQFSQKGINKKFQEFDTRLNNLFKRLIDLELRMNEFEDKLISSQIYETL